MPTATATRWGGRAGISDGEGIVGVDDQEHGRDGRPVGPDRRRLWWGAGAVALALAARALVGGGLAPPQALAKKPPG